MAVAKLDLRDQIDDLDGFLNAGGRVYTYRAGTTTPLATYPDSSAASANANPLILDSSGQGHIWLTVGLAYKFIFTDANGVTLYTEDDVTVSAGSSGDGEAYDLAFYFLGGPPTASQETFRHVFSRAVSFEADFAGSFGSTAVAPTAAFVETVAKNGVTVGEIVTDTAGASTFSTTAGVAVSFEAVDVLTVTAPIEVDATISGLARTFAGTLG